MSRRLVIGLAAVGLGLVWAPRPVQPRPDAPAPEPRLGPPGGPAKGGPEPIARFGVARLRHPGGVNSLAFRPDGKVVAATASNDPFVRLWDVASGREVSRLPLTGFNPEAGAAVVGYTADGRRLVVADGRTHHVVTFDAASGAVVSRFKASAGSPSAVALSPDGTRAAGRTHAGRLAVWDLETGERVRDLCDLPVGGNQHVGVCFSPDGVQVAACASRNVVHVARADGTGPAREVVIDGQENGVHQLVWPRADRLIAVWYNGFAVHDPATGRQLARRNGSHDHWLRILTPTARGTVFAKVSNLPKVVEIDPDTLEPIPGRVVPVGWQNPVAISRDGRTAVEGVNFAVRLLDAATGRPLHPDLDLAPTRPVDRISFSADGRRMLTHGYNTVRVWDGTTGRPTAVIDRDDGFVYWSALSPDGRWVAGAEHSSSGRVRVWDAATGVVVYREPDPPAGQSGTKVIGFDPTGGLWVSDLVSGNIRLLEVPSGRVVRTIPGFPQTTYVVLSRDGRRLAVAGWTAFAVRDTDPTANWHVVEKYPGRQPGGCGLDQPPCPVPVAFLPDGRLLTARGGTATFWDTTAAPRVVAVREGIGMWLAVSPDGRRMAFRVQPEKAPGALRVWEIAPLAEAYRFEPPGGVSGFGFTPDGRLVVGHPDTSLTVWDFEAVEGHALGPAPAVGTPWDRLASPDPKVGLAAVRQLVADPAAAVPLLRAHCPPDPDRATIAARIADLDADDFRTRDAASKALIAAGEAAEGPLREAARTSPSDEVRTRAEAILRPLHPQGRPSAARVRAVRAVEALERIGTAEAAALLREWAADERTVRGAEAKAAVARLTAAR